VGKAPTGKEYAVEHIHIWRLQDGKVIEHWSVRDDLGKALQLGLIGG
jgi:predicted ester cyclase